MVLLSAPNREPPSASIYYFHLSFKRKPHIFFFWRFQWNFNSISAVSRFFGVQKLKLKVVSLKPRVSTEKEDRWFHWNQGFRLRRRLGGFIETKGFDWEGGRRPSFSVEYPWFQWIPPNLLLSWIPLVSMKSTCPPSQSNTLGFNEIHL